MSESPNVPPRKIKKHHVCFLCLSILPLVPVRLPLTDLLSASFRSDTYSHVLFIPLLSVCLVYLRRNSVFLKPQYCLSWGLPLLLLGMLFIWIVQKSVSFSDRNDYLCGAAFSLACVWLPAFVLSYGVKASRAASFALLFLVLMIPMPTILVDAVVGALQRGSADMTYAMFKLVGLPVDWLGFVFSIRGARFEIAKECSGIHSSLVLFVVSILAGHLFLRSIWGKVCFSVFTVLVAIFKNAVRIVTIACLTVYVDASYYDGWLHRKGGVVFAAFAMAILAPFLLALRKAEPYFQRKQPASGTNEGGALNYAGSPAHRHP